MIRLIEMIYYIVSPHTHTLEKGSTPIRMYLISSRWTMTYSNIITINTIINGNRSDYIAMRVENTACA